MFKKLIFIIPTAVAILTFTPTYASALEEGIIEPSNEVMTEFIEEPTAPTEPLPATNCVGSPDMNCTPVEGAESSDAAEGEAETSAADPEETNPANQSDSEDPAPLAKLKELMNSDAWPIALSASALALTIILIIIINLIAHKKSREIQEGIEKQ